MAPGLSVGHSAGMRAWARRSVGRLRGEGGFFLLELRAVSAVMALAFGITPVAVVKMANAARESSARAELTAALPLVEAYHVQMGTYVGLSPDVLRAVYDPNVSPNLAFGSLSDVSYCVSATADGHTAHVVGPGGSPESGGCPAVAGG